MLFELEHTMRHTPSLKELFLAVLNKLISPFEAQATAFAIHPNSFSPVGLSVLNVKRNKIHRLAFPHEDSSWKRGLRIAMRPWCNGKKGILH
ncbi:hypothetical protein BCY86_07830 [Pajaroellobacter abortibovis]|uniref:Uncharacterized protein n=1 Tax=Pajaroellobacter abortibovis TaxID=1882918 RepID=A0A1L6MYI4_9BACT|nr:hypothetical protein BCY86_07830 [Pajaroellobacter abortibovis]